MIEQDITPLPSRPLLTIIGDILSDPFVSVYRGLKQMWHYRALIRNFVTRDLKVRYKHSVLGFIWSLFNPLLMMIVYTFVFEVLLPNKAPTSEPYYAFLLIGLLPWNYCVTSVMGSINSLVGNANLINKVYFPRQLLPTSLVLSNLVNYLLANIVLFVVLITS